MNRIVNPYRMPVEQQKERAFHHFAKMVVVCILAGLVLAAVIYQTKWGF